MMGKKEPDKEKELSIDDRLDQIIDMKKSENSALKKIFESLKNTKDKTHKDKL